ncbi:MAG: ferritin family protein [Burkholderiaceae bacterium]|nr:ferritin family protein [Burkholderiaceae bacterium]
MRASLLMRDPEIQSVSMALLVGIASAIERESLKRYATLADTMERRGEAATAAAFRVMLEEERHHVDEVARWAAGLGEQVPEPGRFDWKLPAELSSSWDEIAGSALLTPYRAFAIAVDNEKRAFALYSYLAARATDPRVRAQAERLGIEELRHAAVMRRWRREAWHRERRAAREEPQPAAAAVASADALHALLATREAAIAQAHRTIAARLREIGDDESAVLLETLLERPSRPAASAAGPPAPVPDTDDPVHLLVAAQKPLETLSEELEAVMGAATGPLFEQSEAALVNVVTRLARIALRTAHALQAS